MPNPIVDVARQQRQELNRRDSNLVSTLTRAYREALGTLDSSIEALNQELLRLNQSGEEISSSKLFRLARYTSLQKQVIEQLQRFNNFADLTVRSEIPDLVTLANNHSFVLVRDQFQSLQGRKALIASWDKLSTEQVEQTLALLTNRSPFNQSYSATLGEGVADRIEQKLIEAVVIGQNPRQTASVINRELQLGLFRVLNTARTAQIYSYRTATHANYLNNSDVLRSWIWYSSTDLRTCTSCWAKHAQRFPLDHILNDHHQGRCTAIPELRHGERYGIEPIEVENGETLFNRLSESQQAEIMGPTRLQHYKNRDFQFSDLSHPYEDSIYGTMLREATLRELLRNE